VWRAALCVALALAFARGVRPSDPADQAPKLPDLPRLSLDTYPLTLRSELQTAYTAAISNPGDASANGKLGMVLHAHSRAGEAEVCYQRAHLLDPESFRWAYLLGVIRFLRGNFDQAAWAFDDSQRLDPEYLPAPLNLGECLLASGKWQKAAELYEATLRKHPESAVAYYGLGRVRAARKDLNGAIESLRKACELFPNYGPAHYALAQTYKRLRKSDQALEELALYDEQKTVAPEIADRVLEEVRALNADSSDEMRLANELASAGKLEEVAAALETALKNNAQLVEAHVSLITLYGQLGYTARAEEHFQAAVHLDPRNPKSHFNHGMLLASQGKFTEAEQAFRNVLQVDPSYPRARLNLGNMLEAQGNLPGAMAEYRKALEDSPNDPQAHFGLGRVLVNQERYQEGIQHLLKSVNTADEESKPGYLYALGAAYARAGDRENGRRYLLEARERAGRHAQSKLLQSIDEDLQILESDGATK